MVENQRSGRDIMGSLIFPQLSLDSPFSSTNAFVPRTIEKFLAEVSRISGVSEKISRLDDYVNRLQDEMHKIDAFKRELPLCMLLLSDAIVAMKNKLTEYKKHEPEPVLEEFIPLKKSNDLDNIHCVKENDTMNTNLDKMNWMDSVQLWNSDNQLNFPISDSNNKEQILKLDHSKKGEEENRPKMQLMDDLLTRAVRRPFVPYNERGDFPLKMAMEENDKSGEVMGLSLCLPEIKNPMEEVNSIGLSPKSSCSRSGSSGINVKSNSKDGQTARKKRRSWSPELHRRFVNALHQLGGAQAATPKQIREHMQVEGLTNDEVKSHLQKYRLHARKVHPTKHLNGAQTVALGGLLISQEQCGDSLKHRNSQSNSPQGPVLFNSSPQGTSLTGGESMDDEDD